MTTWACILLGGPVYTIDGVLFEWSDRFGPMLVAGIWEAVERLAATDQRNIIHVYAPTDPQRTPCLPAEKDDSHG